MLARIFANSLLLCVFLTLAGCGSSPATESTAASAALTVEEWRDLEVNIKYDPSTFERLKLNDPKLQSEDGWDKFMRNVVVPERKLDMKPEEPSET